jgi:hypothetical protein
MRKHKKIEVFIEFLIFGIILGVVEDTLAVALTTDETITWSTIGIIVLVTIPFAIVGELVVDNIDHLRFWRKVLTKDEKKDEIEG